MAQIRSKQISDFVSSITWGSVTSGDNVKIANVYDVKVVKDELEGSVNSLETVLSGIDQTTANDSINSLEGITSGLASDISGNDGDITDLQSSVNSLETVVTSKASSTLVDGHTNSINSLEAITVGLASDISGNDGDISNLQGSVNSLETVVGAIDQTTANDSINSLETVATGLASDISGNDGDIANLVSSVNSLETITGGLATDISGNDTDISALVASVNSLEALTTSNAGGVSSLDDSVDSLENVFAGILDAGDSLDTMSEIVSLINLVDSDNDTAFAGYTAAANASIDNLEGSVNSLETVVAGIDQTTASDSINSLETVATWLSIRHFW